MAIFKIPHSIMGVKAKNLSLSGTKRLLKEYQMIREDKSLGIEVRLDESEKGEEILDSWDLFIDGPINSLYEGYILHAKMTFPTQYPFQPPTFVFISPIYHPNVYADGTVCISILHTDQDEIIDADIANCTWTPGLNVRTVCLSIISLLNEPNIFSAANVDASKKFRDQIEEYKAEVKKRLDDKCRKINKVL